MRKIKQCAAFALSFILFATLLSAILPSKAWAAPGYDDDIAITSTVSFEKVNFYGQTCDPIDVTSTWSQYLLSDDIPFYSYDYANYNSSAASREAIQASYTSAINNADNGSSWGVNAYSQRQSGQGYDKGYYIMWNPDGATNITFDGNGSVVAHDVYIAWMTFYNGNLGGVQTCEPMINYMGKHTNIISSDTRDPDTDAPALLFFNNANVVYPSGYSGALVPAEPSPPTLVPTTGTVDCGGETPVAMMIYQLGNNGPATLSQTSLGRADWSYSLASNPYSITVYCGDTLASAYDGVSPTATDWVCDVYGQEPHYCVLG